MSRPPGYFNSYLPQGTGGGFAGSDPPRGTGKVYNSPRTTSFFRPYSPQGTGGVFAESSDQIHQQQPYWGYRGGPQETGGLFSEDHSGHNSQHKFPPAGPTKRRPRPIPVWAKLCVCFAIIVAIILAAVLSPKLSIRSNNRGTSADVEPSDPSNPANPNGSGLLSSTLPASSVTAVTASASKPSATAASSPGASPA
ncbi:hypothetical protein FRC05_009410 [Tulasnella sp. 425]|nr:hypothetical protein FRC05_009410 [Tulasnella sp. 425]